MTANGFRGDKYLRATGYNFYVWALVNGLITWPLFSALAGRPWAPWVALLFPAGLIAAGIFLCILNDNRVEKMCGPANPEPVIEAGRLWGPFFLLGLSLTVVFVIRGPAAYVQPLWLMVIGAGYLVWGNFTVREFRWLGWLLLVAGALSGLSIRSGAIPPGLASRPALFVWLVFMALLWIPFGAYINRKYLHAR